MTDPEVWTVQPPALVWVVCPDCDRPVECWDGDYATALQVHSWQDCPGE